MKKNYLLIIILMFCFTCAEAQTIWKSPKYGYEIEIPIGFLQVESAGLNTDFKASKGVNSIAIIVTTIPKEYESYSMWDLLGDLTTFGTEWELGAKEYMNNPIFLKYGKTSINSLGTFWYDYKTENPKLYSKNYQTQKGNKLFTITLTCLGDSYNYYSPIWYRFKNKIKI